MITPVSELNDINFYGVTLQDVDDTSLLKGGEGEYTVPICSVMGIFDHWHSRSSGY